MKCHEASKGLKTLTPDHVNNSLLPASTPEAPHLSGPLLRRTRIVAYIVILGAVAVLPYLNSLRNGFVYDDSDQVLANPYVHSLHHLREIFTTSVWSFMGDFRGSSNFYRPMMSLEYIICYRLFGADARGFHLANLLANAGIVLLVFLVTLRMFRNQAVALVTSCIFALHPIHTEAVDWIAAVTELELALFYLLTFWFFLISARPSGKCSIPLQAAMGGSFVLTLLSKEQAFTLPLVAAVYEHFFREDRSVTARGQKVRRYALLWLLAVIYFAIRVRYLGGFAPSLYRPELGIEDLLVASLALVSGYGWKLVWPRQLCAYYLYPANIAALYRPAIGGAVALGICVLALVALRKSQRQAAFGVIWLLATLAPVLNVRWMSSNPFAERYLYLCSLGFCWVIGGAGIYAWNWLSARGSRWRFALVLGAGVIATLSACRIVARNRDWHDNITFYKATLAVSPDAYYMHNNLGTVYWAQGNVKAAAEEWRVALRLAPASEYVLHNLGLVANEEKRYPEAEAYLLRALAIRPNYSDAHLDLGKTYEATGRLPEAEAQFRAAESLSPLNVRAHIALSEFYFDRRQLREAEAEALRSVEITPTPQGDWDLGLAEWLQGNHSGAESAFLDAERINPADSRSHFMLGLLYLDSGRYTDATREYRAGLLIDPTNAEAFANLKKSEFLAGQK